MSIVPKGKPSYCLDLLGERTQNGTPIDVWECTAGLLGQQWYFDAGSFKIRSAVDPKKCIDATGSQLTLNDCSDARTSQLFGWDLATNSIYLTPDKGALKPTGSMCMATTDAVKEGEVIELAACDAKNEFQKWEAVVGPPPKPTKNETFTFSPDADAKSCLDLQGGKLDNGSPVILSTCSGNKSQEWIFSQGTYRITSALNPNKCIDATTMAKGNPLILWDCNGFKQQQWGYQQTQGKPSGTVYLTQGPSDNTGCLATYSVPSATPSTIAVVGDCVQWRLTRVKAQITIV